MLPSPFPFLLFLQVLVSSTKSKRKQECGSQGIARVGAEGQGRAAGAVQRRLWSCPSFETVRAAGLGPSPGQWQ